jgi:hypothetical protein
MLRYMGSIQLPRKYPVNADYRASPAQLPCSICPSRVWTTDLYPALEALPASESRWVKEYQITAEELRNSVLQGCQFCRTLADGIHGRVFLDEMYERFMENNASLESDGGDSDTHNTSDNLDTDEPMEGDEHIMDDGSSDNTSDMSEEHSNDDSNERWDIWDDRDTLTIECNFRIQLSFERGEGDQFTFLNVRVHSCVDGSGERNALQKLQEERAVDLPYRINATGTFSSLPGCFTLTCSRRLDKGNTVPYQHGRHRSWSQEKHEPNFGLGATTLY